MINNYPIHIEPGKGRYVFIFVLNERAVTFILRSVPVFTPVSGTGVLPAEKSSRQKN